MKAVLLENHPLLRAGLAQLLAHPTLDLEVLAPALPSGEPGELQPVDVHADLLVVGLDEVDAPVDATSLRRAIASSRARHVVVLAASVSAEEAHVAMTCGVDAYVAKSQSPEVLLATLRLVLAGGQSYPALMPRAANAAAPMLALSAAQAAQRLNVSLRQYEVLVLLSRGHSVKGVGRLLGISEATVKTHACTLYRRLNVRNKSEAVYAAMRLGIPLEMQGVAATSTPTAEAPDEADVFVEIGQPTPGEGATAVDTVMVQARPAALDPGAESRWAAMTRAFGGLTPAQPMRTPVRTANGTAHLS